MVNNSNEMSTTATQHVELLAKVPRNGFKLLMFVRTFVVVALLAHSEEMFFESQGRKEGPFCLEL
jgi:hypothetical protein